MKNIKTKYLLMIVLLISSFFVFACSADNNAEEELAQEETEEKPQKESKATEEIRVASWSQSITEQTNLLVDEEKGFYKDQAVEVNFIPGSGGGDAIKNILTDQADIAFTDPGSLYAALDKGEKLVAVYNIYPQNIFNVLSLKEKNIKKPEDLEGKTIGVYSLSSGTRQNLLVLLQQVGLTEEDVNIVETGLLNFAPLMQGQVDATAATDTGLAIGKEKGLGDVDVMEVREYLNVPSDIFVVTEETYKEKKELIERFLKAYQNSAQWMIDSPEEAASLAVEYAIDGKDESLNLEIINLRNQSSLASSEKEKTLGELNLEILQEGADVYQKLGLINNKLDMSQVVVNDLILKK